MSAWTEWALDITWIDTAGPCFVPYERETDAFVTGMNLLYQRSPGRLVAVISDCGQEHVEAWCAENPNWAVEFGPEAGGEP